MYPYWYKAKMLALNLWRNRRVGLPDTILIEISTACNRRCSYCPQAHFKIKQSIIPEEMWQLFLARLREINWRGVVTLGSLNEVSIVPDSVRYVREIADLGAIPFCYSNGDRPDVLEEWLNNGMKRVNVTEHMPSTERWRRRIHALSRKYPFRVKVVRIRQPHNFGGQIPVGTPLELKHCYLTGSLNINMHGFMNLCCVDYTWSKTFGNIKESSLLELWRGAEFNEAKSLVARGMAAMQLCQGCLAADRQPVLGDLEPGLLQTADLATNYLRAAARGPEVEGNAAYQQEKVA